MERKMSILARVWISLCMVACVAAVVFLFIAMLANNGAAASQGGTMLAWLIVSVVNCFLCLAGYIILMCCRKAGFFFVMAVAFAYAMFCFAVKMASPGYLSLAHPAITLLLIRDRWGRWEEAAERKAEVRRRTKKLKSRKTALILAALPWTGFLGIDRFYLGYIGLGILKFLTAGGCLVLYVIDIVKIARGTMLDKYGRPLA